MGEKIIKAKDFMTKYVFSIPPDVTVHELVKLFVTHPVSAVPVVGDDNELLGIVSEGDLLYKKVKPKVPAYLDILGAKSIIADSAGMKDLSESFWRHRLRI